VYKEDRTQNYNPGRTMMSGQHDAQTQKL